MKLFLSQILITLLAFPPAVHASEYHFDSYLSYGRENTYYRDTDHWRTSLQYYWNPISYASDYPNKEAIFINRLGSIGFQYRGSNSENYFEKKFTTGIDAEIRYADKGSDHVFQFNYSWDNISETFDYSRFLIDINRDAININGGSIESDLNVHQLNFSYQYYLLDNLTVGTLFQVGFFSDSFVTDNTYTYGIDTKYLLGFGDTNWLALKASYSYKDFGDIFNIDSVHNITTSAEYYFTPQTSLKLGGGAAFINNYSKTLTTGSIQIAAYHYFFDPFAVFTGFEYYFDERGNTQAYTVGANFRF